MREIILVTIALFCLCWLVFKILKENRTSLSIKGLCFILPLLITALVIILVELIRGVA